MTVRLPNPIGKDIAEHWVQCEESPRRVRIVFGGETLADSRHVLLLREAGCLPAYYFPTRDVSMERLKASDYRNRCPHKGEAVYFTVVGPSRTADRAAWNFTNPPPECAELRDYFSFEWNQMDAWYEEDEEIFVHPRDPYKRVDVVQSSRHVQVLVGGEEAANTRRPRLLFETNHPVRYYLPPQDARGDLLIPSSTVTRCPYKGVASYWSVRIGERTIPDLVWSYVDPIPECPKVRGYFCFFQEREVEIFVDGERLSRPRTKWASGLPESSQSRT
jgi:uncharacterized protein (DUF427 family)